MDWLSFFDFQFTRILTLTFDIFSPYSTHMDLSGGERSNQETLCFSHEEFFLPKRFLENFLKEISLLTKETQWSQRYTFSFLCEWVKAFFARSFWNGSNQNFETKIVVSFSKFSQKLFVWIYLATEESFYQKGTCGWHLSLERQLSQLLFCTTSALFCFF